MADNPKDNYLETLKQIKQAIVDNAGLGLRDHDKKNLLNEIEHDSADSYVSVEFEQHGTNVNLYVRFKAANEEARRQTDARGNEFLIYHASVSISWPSHGSVSPTVARARLKFYTEATEFANLLEAQFGNRDIVQLYRTADQIKKTEQDLHDIRIRTKLRNVVEANRHNMRVGSTRNVQPVWLDAFANGNAAHSNIKIEAGTYHVPVDCNNGDVKHFTLDVDGLACGILTRTV